MKSARSQDGNTIQRVAIGLAVMAITLVAASPGHAQTTFSNESLRGTYSVYNTAGDVGSWGLASFDGVEEWTIDTTINVPDGMGGRNTIDLPPGTGTYLVDADGTGTATVFFPGLGEVTYGFVISQVSRGTEDDDDDDDDRRAGSDALATEVSTVLLEGGVLGQLTAPVFKRISD